MNNRLYVSGLKGNTTDRSLATLFTRAGTVESSEVVIDKDSGEVRGFGFVVMSNESEATHAITLLDGIIFEGRSITVYAARPRIVRNRPQTAEDGVASS